MFSNSSGRERAASRSSIGQCVCYTHGYLAPCASLASVSASTSCFGEAGRRRCPYRAITLQLPVQSDWHPLLLRSKGQEQGLDLVPLWRGLLTPDPRVRCVVSSPLAGLRVMNRAMDRTVLRGMREFGPAVVRSRRRHVLYKISLIITCPIKCAVRAGRISGFQAVRQEELACRTASRSRHDVEVRRPARPATCDSSEARYGS